MTNPNRFETILATNKKDKKDRQVGYKVIIVTNANLNNESSARIQKVISVNGEWKDYGPGTFFKYFETDKQAAQWAYPHAKKLIAKLK